MRLYNTWHEVGEKKILGLELYDKTQLIEDTTEAIKTIRQHIEIAQSRQKSYADDRCKPLKFTVDDYVFIKITPMKGIMQFWKKRKFSPQYIGPHEITRRVGKVAHKL